MLSEEQITALRQHVANTVADELARADIDWSSFDQLARFSLSIDADFYDGPAGHVFAAQPRPSPGRAIRQVIDLTRVVSPRPTISPVVGDGSGAENHQQQQQQQQQQRDDEPTSGIIVPLSRAHAPTTPAHDATEGVPGNGGGRKRQGKSTGNEDGDASEDDDDDDSEEGHDASRSRMAISGLRPSRRDVPVVEDSTQRQMQVVSGNFPKRRKAEAVGYLMKPSTLDKLIVGIWEQLHSGANMDPLEILGQFGPTPGPSPLLLQDVDAVDAVGGGGGGGGDGPRSLHDNDGTTTGGSYSLSIPGFSNNNNNSNNNTSNSSSTPQPPPLSSSSSSSSSLSLPGRQFNDTTAFCRRVTQASRTCRSIEVVVQARWTEHFDAYVAHLRAGDARTTEKRHRAAALAAAAAGFGWAEKELRNKMAVWRGYREIKDAGGWAALVFAGMGVYRFCKYRVGFDPDSMQRLRHLRPALEVAADTLCPGWRRLLSVVGASSPPLYAGHPHDWVVRLDGSPPLPLRDTYLQWDPAFAFGHIDESVVDQAAWGGDDPRWTPPPPCNAGSFRCPKCGAEQSDDARANACFCFPSLFGCAGPAPAPAPVQVFRTPDGRNNGLLALCGFERGAAVGEFVGVVTRGLEGVDVMESTAGAVTYQISQAAQGNFTRFVNHSCNANSQYERFTWLGTQRIVLVSKGIGPGSEITVNYSDKYWKDLDKKCLCGEKSCRYRRNR